MTTILKETREKAGYTIEYVASILKIRKQYVIDIEENNCAGIPGDTYVKGYRKIYCEFLGIKSDDVDVTPDLLTTLKKAQKIGIIKQKMMLIFSLIMLVIVVSVYAFYPIKM